MSSNKQTYSVILNEKCLVKHLTSTVHISDKVYIFVKFAKICQTKILQNLIIVLNEERESLKNIN